MSNLTEEDRTRIAQATREVVNETVLRRLGRLVREWREEETRKSRVAVLALVFLAVATVVAAVLFF